MKLVLLTMAVLVQIGQAIDSGEGDPPTSPTEANPPMKTQTLGKPFVVDRLMGFDDWLLSDMIEKYFYFGDIRAFARTCKRANRLVNQFLGYLKINKIAVDPSQTLYEAVTGRKAWVRFNCLSEQHRALERLIKHKELHSYQNFLGVEIRRLADVFISGGDENQPDVLRAKVELENHLLRYKNACIKERNRAVACGDTWALLQRGGRLFGIHSKDDLDTPELAAARRDIDYWVARDHRTAMWLKAKNLRSQRDYNKPHFYNYQPDPAVANSIYEKLIKLGSTKAMAIKRKRVDPLRRGIYTYNERAGYVDDPDEFRRLTEFLCSQGNVEAYVDKVLSLFYGLRGYPCDVLAAQELLWDDTLWQSFSEGARLHIVVLLKPFSRRYPDSILDIRVKTEYYPCHCCGRYIANHYSSGDEFPGDESSGEEAIEQCPKYIMPEQVEDAFWVIHYWLADKISERWYSINLAYELLKINGRSFAMTEEIAHRLSTLNRYEWRSLVLSCEIDIKAFEEGCELSETDGSLSNIKEALEWIEEIKPTDEPKSDYIDEDTWRVMVIRGDAQQKKEFVQCIKAAVFSEEYDCHLQEAYALLPTITEFLLLFEAWILVGDSFGPDYQIPIKGRLDELTLTWEEKEAIFFWVKRYRGSGYFQRKGIYFPILAWLFADMYDYVPRYYDD